MNAARITLSLDGGGPTLIRHTLGKLAEQGFAAIINSRPEGEEPGQPGNLAEATAARSVGLAYAFVPITWAQPPPKPISQRSCKRWKVQGVRSSLTARRGSRASTRRALAAFSMSTDFATGACVIIDPVFDFDEKLGQQ